MTEQVFGNVIHLNNFTKDDFVDNTFTYTLPDGYSLHKIKLVSDMCKFLFADNAFGINDYTFPVVNGKSPAVLPFSILQGVEDFSYAEVIIVIQEFGAEPDNTYFSQTFAPIISKNSAGKEYNLIASTQYK